MAEKISMKVNEIRTITLQGAGTTGFSWSFAAMPDGIVKIAAVSATSKGKKQAYGGSGEDKFSITALAKGNVTITFMFSKHWEKDVPAKRTTVFQVAVA